MGDYKMITYAFDCRKCTEENPKCDKCTHVYKKKVHDFVILDLDTVRKMINNQPYEKGRIKELLKK